jgi:subtilase family serine protease
MDAGGDFKVTVRRMTGSFKVVRPPLPAEFVISDLSVEPEEFTLGEGVDDWTFEITVDVTNIGELEGSHTVDLEVDGEVIESGTVTLAGGGGTSITFDVTRGVGVYAVEVAGLTGGFEVKPYVKPLKPAELVVSNLALIPSEVESGGTVVISAMVANVGEMEGSYTVELRVDKVTVESESVTLAGGASREVSFSVSSEEEGEHTVEVDGVSGSFTVESAPPQPFFWPVVVVVVAILVFLIWVRTDWFDKLTQGE